MKGTWQTTSGGGGGGVLLAVIAAAVLLGSGTASAIASAVEVIVIVFCSVIGLAIAGGAGLLIWRIRSDRPGAPIAAREVSQLPPISRPQLEEPSKPALGPGREVHLHLNVSAAELAAIVKHCTEGNQP